MISKHIGTLCLNNNALPLLYPTPSVDSNHLHFWYILEFSAITDWMNLIYFTKIVKQVPQLILISLVGTDRSARRSLIWEEAGGLGENPAGDHYTLPQTSIAYHGDHTYVTALKCECTVHYATWTPKPSTVLYVIWVLPYYFKQDGVYWSCKICQQSTGFLSEENVNHEGTIQFILMIACFFLNLNFT